MRIDELIAGLGVRVLGGEGGGTGGGGRVCDITEDSRTVLPGSLFIARKGDKVDATRFIPDAIAAGAAAILTDNPNLTLPRSPASPHAHTPPTLLYADDVPLATARLGERFYGDPSAKLRLFGVTGTNGKTTTTFLIHQLLNTLGVRCGLIGTVCIDDGVEVATASLTTPPALEISRTLARMLEAGCEAAAIEVSSHALVQRRAAGLSFDAGVFTNLTGDHLDYHADMDEYASAKALLFETLGGDAQAIVNADDPASSRMLKGCRGRVTRCHLAKAVPTPPAGDCRADVRASGATWTDCTLTGAWGRVDVRLPLVGEFNVMNALEAAAAVHAIYGGTGEKTFSFAAIAEALAACHAPPGRLEPVTADDAPFAVFVDYAHTDDALRTVLSVLKKRVQPHGTLWCVFGCGGDRDKTKRPRMGAVAAELADRIVVTSDNPRSEDPRAIIDDIVGGIDLPEHARVTIEPDRERAIRAAISRASAGDIVLIAGKGHEDYQILPAPPSAPQSAPPSARTPGGTITVPFDDREVARRLLGLRGVSTRPLPTPPGAAGACYAAAAGEDEEGEDDELLTHGVAVGEDQPPIIPPIIEDATQP